MKNTLIIISFFILSVTNAQVINFADVNFKNKLLLSSNPNFLVTRDLSYQQVNIDTNGDGEIQVSEAQNIASIYVNSSNINSLAGLEYFINLTSIIISSNNISEFNFPTLVNLQYIQMDNTQLSNFNPSNHPNLLHLTCSGNQLTSLDFRNNPFFRRLSCANNNLTNIYIKNNINQELTQVISDCWSNNPLSYICADASEIPALQSFLTGCGYNLANITITSNCALSEHSFSKNVVKVFPNPSNTGVFSVELPVVSKGKAMVYNALGQKVYENNFVNQTFTLPLNFLPKGTYFLKLITENQEVFEEKLVVN